MNYLKLCLQFPLSEPEQLKLARYIKVEEKIPDFLNKTSTVEIPQEEILVFAYTAGHGCADSKQYYVLNENDINKIFWPI